MGQCHGRAVKSIEFKWVPILVTTLEQDALLLLLFTQGYKWGGGEEVDIAQQQPRAV